MSIKKYKVYVIELLPEALEDGVFGYENRDCNPSLPCYYVGMTSLTPEERFQNHRDGYKSSRIAHRYGVCLVPELYEQYNPMTYEEAKRKELELTAELKQKGHGVWSR